MWPHPAHRHQSLLAGKAEKSNITVEESDETGRCVSRQDEATVLYSHTFGCVV